MGKPTGGVMHKFGCFHRLGYFCGLTMLVSKNSHVIDEVCQDSSIASYKIFLILSNLPCHVKSFHHAGKINCEVREL